MFLLIYMLRSSMIPLTQDRSRRGAPFSIPLRHCKEHELILTWICPHSLYVSADDDDEDVTTLHCLIAVLFLLSLMLPMQ